MSSKKPFDHIEEKIKQAAENSLPAFDEKAWQAMEAKLDKDKRKRRPLLWWFILPLALMGAWGIYYGMSDRNKPVSSPVAVSRAPQKSSSHKQPLPGENKELTGTVPANGTTTTTNSDPVYQEEVAGTKKQSPGTSNISTLPVANMPSPLLQRNSIAGKKKGRVNTAVTGADPENVDGSETREETTAGKNDMAVSSNPVQEERENVPANPVEQVKESTPIPVTAAEEKMVQNKDVKPAEKPSAAKKEKEKQQDKGWYILAAGGADAGSTKLFSLGNSNVTPKYGIGVGYQFSKRWSVQSGFYAATKKYVADAADYKIKPGSPMAAYEIEKIKASCLVYEIPVSVRYNITNSPSFLLYATAGAASYIMQKEKYDCSYWYYDTVYEQEWLYTGNRHFFSTALFSIGVEKPLSSKFSLLAEPSISIPLTGVGDGKMNIYSSSVLLGIKYYPFKK